MEVCESPLMGGNSSTKPNPAPSPSPAETNNTNSAPGSSSSSDASEEEEDSESEESATIGIMPAGSGTAAVGGGAAGGATGGAAGGADGSAAEEVVSEEEEEDEDEEDEERRRRRSNARQVDLDVPIAFCYTVRLQRKQLPPIPMGVHHKNHKNAAWCDAPPPMAISYLRLSHAKIAHSANWNALDVMICI